MTTDDPERLGAKAVVLAERLDPWAFEHSREWAALDDRLHEEEAFHERCRFTSVDDELARRQGPLEGTRRRHWRLWAHQSFVPGLP